MGSNKYTPYFIFILAICSLPAFVNTASAFMPYNRQLYFNWATPRDLRDLSTGEIQAFYRSFDTVICDLDETVWKHGAPIHGAIKSLNNLKNCSKKIHFLTNNNVYPKEKFVGTLVKMGFNATMDDITNPSDVLIWYLKKIKFDGTMFVIGSDYLKKTIQNSNISIVTGAESLAENPALVVTMFQHLNKDVKAVVVGLDANVNYAKMLEATAYLQRSDVLFLAGSLDREISLTKNITLLGNSYFVDIIAKHTGRKPMIFGKPGEIMKDYILQTYLGNDPTKTLFIGDSLRNDMKFAEMSGFRRLFVRSGLDSDIPCYNGCEGTPQYQLPDLGKMPQCQVSNDKNEGRVLKCSIMNGFRSYYICYLMYK